VSVKYACIREHRGQFPLSLMCRVLGVSRAGFYAAGHRPESARALRDEQLRREVCLIHDRSRSTYGSPRVHAQLRSEGRRCSRKRVARLMREAGLRVKGRRRRRPQTTDSRHAFGVAENVLGRRFAVEEAGGLDRVWCGDITYVPTREGWLYLAVLLDLGSRAVVGWAMSERLESSLATDALRMAVARRSPAQGLLHHTDRGSQYAAIEYRELVERRAMVASMSRRANCYDNAVAESFFATLEWELIKASDWQTRGQARRALFEYIECWYNRQRRHSSLGYLSPLEYEQRLASKPA
jgi:putative transposase